MKKNKWQILTTLFVIVAMLSLCLIPKFGQIIFYLMFIPIAWCGLKW